MWQNLKWLRLVPDKPGKGGTKTGFHTFQVGPVNDTRVAWGMHVWHGRWRRDFNAQAVPATTDDAGTYAVQSCHGYVYPSYTNPTATPNATLLGHHIGGGFSRYWDFTNNTTRDTHSPSAAPAVWLNIGGRCFVADGAREGMVLDDRTPAIHQQKNQSLGISTPLQPLATTNALTFAAGTLAATVVPNLTGYGFAYCYFGNGAVATTLHSPDPNSRIATILITDKVSVSVIDPNYSAISGAVPVTGVPLSAGRTSNDATAAAAPPFSVGADTISIATGTSVVTRSGAWPVGVGKVSGLRINFNGYSFVLGATDQDQTALGANQYDVNGTQTALGANQAFIIGQYDGPTLTNVPFTITGAELQLVVSNTLQQANAGTLGYSQSTRSNMVPVMVSAVSNDALWFGEFAGTRAGRITTAGAFTEYLSPTASGYNMCDLGPDGNVWFTFGGNGVVRVDPNGVITEFTSGFTAGDSTEGICAGPDGALWVCGFNSNQIYRVSTDGVVTVMATLPVNSNPFRICLGPDRNLWFTENGTSNICKLTTAGTVTRYATPTAAAGPRGICAGPDGNLWYCEAQPAGPFNVGRCSTSGAQVEFPTGGTSPKEICAGPDGNLWVTESAANVISKWTTAGVRTPYAAGGTPYGICSGPDGNLWYCENAAGNVSKITTGGVITQYLVRALGQLRGIVSASRIRNLGNITVSGTGTPISPAPWAPPKYAYALYDPETGHMSNISPITTIATPPTNPPTSAISNYQHVTPYFRIDSGALAYPTGAAGSPTAGTDGARFSHVVFFRTLSTPGASTLYPIGSLMPFVGKVHPGSASTRGSWNPLPASGWMGLPNVYTDAPPAGASPNYWFDFSSDSDLLLNGGFRAPQETNAKPMVTLRGGVQQAAYPVHMAYWDGRLWVVPTQAPDTILYSCDTAQSPLGIPQESFPPTNILTLPAMDGQVMGMRVFGEMLLITTQRWAYTIAGNNESNYRLLKVSASMPGVGTYQMSEIASDMEGAPSTVYYLGRDKIVYQWMPGGKPVAISGPIQNYINAAVSSLSAYQGCRLHCSSAWGRRTVVLGLAYPQPPLLYDIDNMAWTLNPTFDGGDQLSWSPPGAFATVYGLDPPVNELYDIAVPNGASGPARATLRSWLRDDGTTTTYPSYIQTFPLNFDGAKARKQICAVNLHVSATAGGTYTVSVYANEATFFTGTAHAYGSTAATDALYSVYGAGGVPQDGATAADLVTMTADLTSGVRSTPIIGYRFVVTITTTVPVNPTEIFAVDVAYVDVEEPGDGDA